MNCEPSSENVIYKEGDIVWVKLGATWWPGEVKNSENLPAEVEFKKPPLAVVKFFDEETYEYVRSWSNICPYNCDKKVEFIKKGMAAFRTNVSHMQKFPKDVSNAEVLLGGNPNILSEPMFIPEKKRSYSDDESPTRKGKTPKIHKEKKPRPKKKKVKSHITHRRFLGFDDYKAYVWIQSPDKDRIPGDRDDDEVILLNKEPDREYTCYSCCFSTKRLEVMVIHMKYHGVADVSLKNKRPLLSKSKKVIKKPKTSPKMGQYQSSMEKEASSQKKNRSLPLKLDDTSTEDNVEEKPKNPEDIRSNLLAEWDDSDDEQNCTFNTHSSSVTEVTDTSILDEICDKTSDGDSHVENNSNVIQTEDLRIEFDEFSESNPENIDKTKKMDQDTQLAIKSCFDFDEEDEEEGSVIIPTTLTGRKIPRVIPVTERKRSCDLQDQLQSIDDVTKEKKEDNLDESHIENDNDNFSKKELDIAFNELMKTTSMPELPDIHPPLKCEQNFHGSKTIKFPDKLEEENPSTKTIDKSEKIEPSNFATRLINPKKRFVKSFEDFEYKQNEMKKKELNETKIIENQTENRINVMSPNVEEDHPTTEFLKLKTRIMSKIIEEANITEESRNKIMAKMENSSSGGNITSSIVTSPKNESTVQPDNAETSAHIKVDTGPDKDNHLHDQKPDSKMVESLFNEDVADISQKEIIEPDFLENPGLSVDSYELEYTSINQKGMADDVQEKVPPKKKLSRQTNQPKRSFTLCGDKIESNQLLNIETVANITKIVKNDANQLSENIIPRVIEADIHHNLNSNLAMDNEHLDNSGIATFSNDKHTTLHTTEQESCVELQQLNDNTIAAASIENSEKNTESKEIISKPSEECLLQLNSSTVNEVSLDTELLKENETVEQFSLGHSLHSDKFELNITEKIPCPIEDGKNYPTKTFAEQTHILESEDLTGNQDYLKTQMKETSCSFETLLGSEKEEYDALEKASLNLPEDAICSPPRKRRRSEVTGISEITSEENFSITKRIKNDFIDDEAIENNASIERDDCHNENVTNYLSNATLLPDDNTMEQVNECVNHLVHHVCQSQFEPPSNSEPKIETVVEKKDCDDILQSRPLSTISSEYIITKEVVEMKTHNANQQEISSVDSEDPADSSLCISDNKKIKMCQDENTNPRETNVNSPKATCDNSKIKREDHGLKEEIISKDIVDFAESDNLFENGEGLSKNDQCTIRNMNKDDMCIEKLFIEHDLSENQNKNVHIPDNSMENNKVRDDNMSDDASIEIKEQKESAEVLSTQKGEETEIFETNVNRVKDECNSEQSETSQQKEITLNKYEFPKSVDEYRPNEEVSENQNSDMFNQVEIHCAERFQDSLKFSIKTNLTNITGGKHMSNVCSTTIAEAKSCQSSDSDSNMSCIENDKSNQNMPYPQQELVPIEGNLTVVSETDLADGQVEITPEQVISSKKLTSPSHFYAEFSDSTDDSSSTNDTLSDSSKGFDSRGTEFTSRAIHKEVTCSVGNKKSSTYGRNELLNILEGNSDLDKKTKEVPQQKNVIEDFCDFEDHIPSQIVCAKKLKQEKDEMIKEIMTKPIKNCKIASTTSKLLERLTENKKDNSKCKTEKFDTINKQSSSILGTKLSRTKGSSKPIILSEKIMKPAVEKQTKKCTTTFEDIEDVEAFIIHKDPKKTKCDSDKIDMSDQEPLSEKKSTKGGKQSGKAKIIQQTIITASGEIIQPAVTSQTDETVFDINSMPIVLSDEILTPEHLEKIPIVLSASAKSTTDEKVTVTMTGRKLMDNKILPKITSSSSPSTAQASNRILNTVSKSFRSPRILQNSANRVIHKGSPLLPNTSKSGKFILVPPSSSVPSTKGIVKKMVLQRSPTSQKVLPSNISEVGGNKIMILTNQQGQQQRLLLTPAQQKLLGCQTPISKISKTFQGNIVQSNIALSKKLLAPSSPDISNLANKSGSAVIPNSSVTDDDHIVTTSNSTRSMKATIKKATITQKSSQSFAKIQQTISSKNLQPIKHTPGTEEDLEKQVAAQLEAIKASTGMKFDSPVKIPESAKTSSKSNIKRSYLKKNDVKMKISPNLMEAYSSTVGTKKSGLMEPVTLPTVTEPKSQSERQLNQLVIQDAVGNQTTITEGQILALPSETVDGQPQSYMLVTLDQTGNLTPLNNEALMSLDPNLGLGGDISNVVLQIEQGSLPSSGLQQPPPLAQTAVVKSGKNTQVMDRPNAINIHALDNSETLRAIKPKVTDILTPDNVAQSISSNTNKETGQQLIISGDPIATQKFLESLTEGSTDLANLLANAEGNSILIQADGQQILINAESDNQLLLSVNNDNSRMHENRESGGNPILATHSNKSQDILAAALADTDVFQQDQHSSQSKFPTQLSPNNSLYPINVGNVLETSLTLSSPIMTPLEVPSTNNKKILDEETDILTQVPKNVDLPITITDPNISQTVANQQVASLIATELQTNLELNLPISETMTSISKDVQSPSYSYSLPPLDDSSDISHKTFSGSMPLLTDDDTVTAENNVELQGLHLDKSEMLSSEKNELPKETLESNTSEEVINRTRSFLDDDDEEEEEEGEGRFTLGREMCSSLSEPPPEMFDLADVNSGYVKNSLPSSLQSTPDPNEYIKDDITDLSMQAESSNDGSCEIPVQPKIIAKSQNLDLLNSD